MAGEAVTTTWYNVGIVFFVALGSFTYGFNSSIMGTVFGLSSFFDYFNLPQAGSGTGYTSSIEGATNGLYSAGGIFGCLLISRLADAFGRKRAVQLICIICILSAILQAASVHIVMLLVGRFFNGIGTAMMCVIVPLYQSEVSPPSVRGRLVGSHGFLVVVGYNLAAFTGLGSYFATNPQLQWRLPLALQVVAPLVLALGSPMVPESPRWLFENHRNTEAMEVLCNLHSAPGDTDSNAAHAEGEHIRQQLAIDDTQDHSLRAIILRPSYRKRFLMGFYIQFLAQSTGVLVINNYQVILYNGLGLFGYLPLLLYAMYTLWAAFLNWVGSMVVDRFGRVRMLTIGIIGCVLMVSCEAAMVATYGGTSNKIGNGFGVFFLFAFVTFYGSCVDAVSYIYCAELFPTSLRAQGVGFSILGQVIASLIYTLIAPTAFDQVGWRYYLVFIVLPVVGAPLLHFFFIETKGLSLEEIGALFGDHVFNESATPVDFVGALPASEEKKGAEVGISD
ncbi:general substrate transporter [Ophiostoma piceae UAMH 11346]|uniref:General substrate transporter n=1 Tax=Ophiostoma piceae (strain UAMH 11346) TaxID=1262450 RepID=S3CPC5_OPHP1|nr:general substrate transporter [Ophiostoma piceae UAMH 11346]